MKTRKCFYFGKFAVLGILGLIVFTFVVMWLWNWLVPELFNGPVIGYWQTLGLLLLSKILFSGIGKGHHSHGANGHRHPWKDKDKWKMKFEAKMNGKAAQDGAGEDPVVTD